VSYLFIYLGQQVVVKVLIAGSKLMYSTKLSKVVGRVKGREATTEHSKQVGTRDKDKAILVISRS